MRRETMTNVGMLQPGTSEYEAFLSRDQRIVYARYKDRRADIFLLEQGQAEAQREFTRANLECMMPDCSDRRLTTVSRSNSGRRDGFRHFAKGHGNHSPESLNHQQAKLAVASWITRRHSGLLVQLEELVGARDRVADCPGHLGHLRQADGHRDPVLGDVDRSVARAPRVVRQHGCG